jgi:exonuclease SbcD
VAHALVAGGEPSESERPLSIGGASTVPVECFAGIHYVALGHLHRPQKVGSERVQYSGSLLKYSFSEADHAKSVTLVEMDAAGACRVSRARLAPRRDVRCIQGNIADLLKGPKVSEGREDYLSVTLLDRGAILDAMGKLREVYPNVLHIERPVLSAAGAGPPGKMDHHKVSDEQLFGSFFKEVTGEELKDEERAAYAATTAEMRRREREEGK